MKSQLKIVFLLHIFFGGFVNGQEPNWEVNEGEFSSSMSLIGEFYLNESLFSSSNIVGAFVGEECRGIASSTDVGDGSLYLMTIYGNISGETILLKAWIASDDEIVNIDESIEFSSNEIIGSISDPIQFNAYLNFDFPPVISGIPDQTIHMGEEFATITLGEFLTLEDNNELVWTTSEADNITINKSNDVITLIPDSSWIGSEQIIFTVTEVTSIGHSSSDTAIFTQLRADTPPLLSEIPDQFIGENGNFAPINIQDYVTELDGDSISFNYSYGTYSGTHEQPIWAVDPFDFQYSMSVIASIESRGERAQGNGHVLVAMDGFGEVRGVCSATSYGDGWRYMLTVYANNEGEEITFRFFNNEDNLNIPIMEKSIFSNDDIIGSLSDPILLSAKFIDVSLNSSGYAVFNRVDQNWRGSESVIFTIKDETTQNNYSSSDEVIFTISENFEPVLSGIPDQVIYPGENFSQINLLNYLETYDADNILWSFTGNTELNIEIIEDIASITYEANWIGLETVVFTATDDNNLGLSNSDTVSFSVQAEDNHPILGEIPDQIITIGNHFSDIDLENYLTELDGDSVQWSFEFLPYPDIVEAPDWLAPASGEYNMQVVAIVEALGYDAAGSDHLLIALNDDDIIGLAQGSSFSEFWVYNMFLFSNENNFEFRFLFYDNNSQRILPVNETYTFISQSQIGSLTQPLQLKAGRVIIDINQQNLVSIDILSKNWEYPEIIRFRASDIGTVNSLSSSKNITLMIDNDLPQLTLEAQIINEGGLFNPVPLINYIYDNGTSFDSIDVTVSSGPNYNAQIINDTLYVDSPEDENWNGIELVNFEVTDAHPYDVKTLESQIEFIILPINDAPVLSNISNQTIEENDSLDLFLQVVDVDTGETLIFSASSSSSDIDFIINSADSILTIIPAADWNGSADIMIIVSDGELQDSTSFLFTVGSVNDAPTIEQISNMIMNEDDLLEFSVEISDVDEGDMLSLSIISDTSSVFVNVDSENHIVTARPDTNWHGSAQIHVIVSDAQLTDTSSFILTVLPINDAPIISTIASGVIPEDSIYIANFNVTDVDTGTTFTFEAYSDTNSVSLFIDPIGFNITARPDTNWHGSAVITVITSDQFLSDTSKFVLEVYNTGDIPFAVIDFDTLISIQKQSMVINAGSSYDIDNDSLVYVWLVESKTDPSSSLGTLGDTVITSYSSIFFETPDFDDEKDLLIKLWVKNSSNLTSEMDSLHLDVKNIEPNDILPNTQSVSYSVGNQIPLEFYVPNSFSVDSIYIEYGSPYSGFSKDFLLPISHDDGGVFFQHTIPFYLTGLEGLVYYVNAKDSIGSFITTDTTELSLNFNDGFVTSGILHSEFSNGFPRSTWKMVSVPGVLNDNNVQNIFNSSFDQGPSNEGWMIYDWVGADNEQVENFNGWILPDSILSGKAYWMKQVMIDNPIFSTGKGRTVDLNGFEIKTSPGWNIIGSPYLFPVLINLDSEVFSELYVYGKNEMEGWVDTVVTVLRPWAGYAVYNKTDNNQFIKLSPLRDNIVNASRHIENDGWQLNVNVESGSYLDQKNIFGVSSRSTNDFDNFDCPELPVHQNYISLYSKNNEKKLSKDIRQSDTYFHIWDIILESNLNEQKAVLNFRLNGQVESGEIWFMDLQNGDNFNVNEKLFHELELYQNKFSNRYKVVYGSKHEVENFLDEIKSMIPDDFSLGNNFPNPFNPKTKIPFSLPEPSFVSIMIYDLKGQHIRTLLYENKMTGYHTVLWDGKDKKGLQVSSGMYYYGIKTPNFNKFKKLVLLK